jgi:hypothetical protein
MPKFDSAADKTAAKTSKSGPTPKAPAPAGGAKKPSGNKDGGKKK